MKVAWVCPNLCKLMGVPLCASVQAGNSCLLVKHLCSWGAGGKMTSKNESKLGDISPESEPNCVIC